MDRSDGLDLGVIEREALSEIEKSANLAEVETLYTRYLGRKDGALTNVLRNLAALPPEQKKTTGQAANELRQRLELQFTAKKKILQSSVLLSKLEAEKIDLSLPGTQFPRGYSHPIIQTITEISDIFKEIGFDAVEGPEIETDFNNFTALNIPPDHPARDLHDTFYLSEKESGTNFNFLLRTHTSPVQIRLMQAVKPPVRIIAPGRVYRHEAVDATHAAIFHQIEGLAVDTNITFADLKGTLTHFAQRYFGEHTNVRFRPSYFPFVEPGAEMDLTCFRCQGEGKLPDGKPCGLCKASGWIEMLGAGMVHPKVLKNVGYDPKKYTGFAFGMGVERIVMTRLRVNDIRLFLDSDLRFLEQFK